MMRRILSVLCLGLLLTVAHGTKVKADTSDFTINSFSADYTLTNADPQGEMHVVENIDVTFTDNNHGIFRYIPKSYMNHSLKLKINSITSRTGAATNYTTSSQSGNTVLKIGDAGRTYTGNQSYTIDYTIQNVITITTVKLIISGTTIQLI